MTSLRQSGMPARSPRRRGPARLAGLLMAVAACAGSGDIPPSDAAPTLLELATGSGFERPAQEISLGALIAARDAARLDARLAEESPMTGAVSLILPEDPEVLEKLRSPGYVE